ncbi:hypothetical protein FCIRC_1223 [Fusarium circinatum]|uniref:Uncharacterized protein n=1 Tax=Fusarium circinatum TaxID=48490 RepID=A0A8H5UL01_FUSCI|nr:hypothetical protein FCIRC_1223 [Fusarium circinatum]
MTKSVAKGVEVQKRISFERNAALSHRLAVNSGAAAMQLADSPCIEGQFCSAAWACAELIAVVNTSAASHVAALIISVHLWSIGAHRCYKNRKQKTNNPRDLQQHANIYLGVEPALAGSAVLQAVSRSPLSHRMQFQITMAEEDKKKTTSRTENNPPSIEDLGKIFDETAQERLRQRDLISRTWVPQIQAMNSGPFNIQVGSFRDAQYMPLLTLLKHDTPPLNG